MKPIISRILIVLFALTALTSCKGNGVTKKQNVSGRPGEIIVVIDKGDWESEVGQILKDNLESDYEILPQREAKFNLYNINPVNFTSLFWIHRNILIFNISPEVEETRMISTKDVWAQPQTVIKINAKNRDEAVALLKEKIDIIDSTFEQAERDRIIANNIKFQQNDIRPAVTAMTGGAPYFPMGYSIKKADDKFMWISYETTYVSQYVFVFKYPVTGKDDLTLESILEKSNAVLKENVPGPIENSYMITAPLPTPTINYIKYRNRDFAEVRGLWEVQNDYMGGPFVLHTFYDQKGENIISLLGFVYAPKYDKRNYLRQVESIIYSFEWDKTK